MRFLYDPDTQNKYGLGYTKQFTKNGELHILDTVKVVSRFPSAKNVDKRTREFMERSTEVPMQLVKYKMKTLTTILAEIGGLTFALFDISMIIFAGYLYSRMLNTQIEQSEMANVNKKDREEELK